MIIVYIGHDEAIAFDASHETEALRTYFTEGGRDFSNYERRECRSKEVVHIRTQVSCDIEEPRAPNAFANDILRPPRLIE